MAMNLEQEKTLKLTAQDRYEILDFAIQAAEDGGFLNSFVYHRAIYLYAAIVLFEDRKEELSHIIAKSPIQAWDTLLKDNTINTMLEQYPQEMDILSAEAEKWYNEYEKYIHSARGVLNTVQELSGDIIESAARQLKSSAQETGVSDLLEIADEWGMNRSLDDIKKENSNIEENEESLL